MGKIVNEYVNALIHRSTELRSITTAHYKFISITVQKFKYIIHLFIYFYSARMH